MLIDKLLDEAKLVNAERHETYGDSLGMIGGVAAKLFPNGIELVTPEDFKRYYLIDMIISKLARYLTDFRQPHHDSMLDIGNFAFMLCQLDEEIKLSRLSLSEQNDESINQYDHVMGPHDDESANKATNFMISFPTNIPKKFITRTIQQWSFFKPTITLISKGG